MLGWERWQLRSFPGLPLSRDALDFLLKKKISKGARLTDEVCKFNKIVQVGANRDPPIARAKYQKRLPAPLPISHGLPVQQNQLPQVRNAERSRNLHRLSVAFFLSFAISCSGGGGITVAIRDDASLFGV